MFIQNVAAAGGQIGILAVLMIVGFFCDKGGLFREQTARSCNNLLFYILTPCMICNAFQTQPRDRDSVLLLLGMLAATVLFHLVGALLVAPLFRKDPDRAVYRFAAMYGNVACMLPIAQAMLGDTGVFLCSVMVMVFNVICFTHGTWLMTGKSDQRGITLRNIFINPGTIGIAMGLPLYLTGFTLPDFLGTPISLLAGMNTPLMMIMFGTYLSNAHLLEAVKSRQTYLVLFWKLILLPALMLGACMLLHIEGTLRIACVLLACAPCATNTVLFAGRHHQNAGKASLVTSASVILSIFTMPIWLAVAQTI